MLLLGVTPHYASLCFLHIFTSSIHITNIIFSLISRGPAARENSRNRDWAPSPVPPAECLEFAATQHQSSPAECLES